MHKPHIHHLTEVTGHLEGNPEGFFKLNNKIGLVEVTFVDYMNTSIFKTKMRITEKFKNLKKYIVKLNENLFIDFTEGIDNVSIDNAYNIFKKNRTDFIGESVHVYIATHSRKHTSRYNINN